MGYTDQTLKKLFALSGNVCAFPGCNATIVDTDTGVIVGDICHIKGRSEKGPRYDPMQSEADRNGYDNLLVMCVPHNRIVDGKKTCRLYPVEVLQEYKRNHEAHYRGSVIDNAALDAFVDEFVLAESVITTHNQSGGQNANTINNIYNHPLNSAPLPDSPDVRKYPDKDEEYYGIAAPTSYTAPVYPELFVGRDYDLKAIKILLGLGKTGVIPSGARLAVYGLPGVGKTTLAARLYHDPDIASHFRDGVLWASLGQSPNVLSILATWGRTLGRDDISTAKTPQEASQLLLNHLRNKRLLLIVDDVWEKEDLDPFAVGGRDCATLVTTREIKLTHDAPFPDNCIHKLQILNENSAVALISGLSNKLVESYSNEIRELASSLEYLPLALQVAGRLLKIEYDCGAKPHEIKNLFKELRDGERILGEIVPGSPQSYFMISPTVGYLLKKSTDRLDEVSQERFTALGSFVAKPSIFNLDAVNDVWGLKPREGPLDTIKVLVTRGLLEHAGEGRYQIHALLRVHARSLFSGAGRRVEDRLVYERRNAGHYLSVLQRVNTLYKAGATNAKKGLEAFDLDWRNIEAGQAWSAANKQKDLNTAKLCNEYARAGKEILEVRVVPRVRIEWLYKALVAARRLEDQTFLREHMVSLGNVYLYTGQSRKALAMYREYLTLSEEYGNRREVGDAKCKLGSAYSQIGKDITAVRLLKEALQVAHDVGDRKAEAEALCWLGSAQNKLLQSELAVINLINSYEIYKGLKDQRGQAEALFELGQVRDTVRINEKTHDCINLALRLARNIGDRRLEARILIHKSFSDDVGHAVKKLRSALSLAKDVGDLQAEGLALVHLARASIHFGREEEAKKLINQAINNSHKRQDKKLDILALFYYALDKLVEPIPTYDLLQSLQESLKIIEDKELEYLILVTLSQILIKGVKYPDMVREEGRILSAAYYVRGAIKVAEELRETSIQHQLLKDLSGECSRVGVELGNRVVEKLGRRDIQRQLLEDLSYGYARFGMTHESITYYEQAQLIPGAASDSAAVSEEKKLEYAQSLLVSARKSKDRASEQRALGLLQPLCYRLGKGQGKRAHDFRLEYLTLVRDIEEQLLTDSKYKMFQGYYIGEWFQIGDIYWNEGDYEKALSVYEEGFNLILKNNRYFLDEKGDVVNEAPIESARRLITYTGAPTLRTEHATDVIKTLSFPDSLAHKLSALRMVAEIVLKTYPMSPSHRPFYLRDTVMELHDAIRSIVRHDKVT
jgi:tetratricopeptide (TPR) repeat protein